MYFFFPSSGLYYLQPSHITSLSLSLNFEYFIGIQIVLNFCKIQQIVPVLIVDVI